MRKVLAFLAASLSVACAGVSQAQQAPDMFKDLDRGHWAYEAVESLRSKGIVVGYPDGYFRGKRTLTRYEFAVALDRALKKINIVPQPGPQGPAGANGEAGPAGAQGPPGVTPEELATLRRLLQEFRNELAALGNNMRAIQDRLDKLARDVADLRATIDKMPKIHGTAFVGVRSDPVNGNYVDRNGKVNPLINNQAVVHLFDLGVSANVAGGATLGADVQFDNYRNYLGGNLGRNPAAPLVNNPGGPTLSSAVPSDTRVDRLEINTPFNGLGRGSKLTLGRFHERLGHYTLWKPDVDVYFDVPGVDDGAYRMDGARLTTNFGSISTEIFGAQTASVTGTTGFGDVNSPLVGSNSPNLFIGNFGVGLLNAANKPIAQANQGQMVMDQLLGASFGLGFHQLQGGHVRFTALETANRKAGTLAALGYDSVLVMGTDIDLKIADRTTFTGDWGQTTMQRGRNKSVISTQNNAFNANLGYNSGGLNLTAGYRYIDPLFYAPGYWGRIGNWINPTNVQGPTVRAGYNVAGNLGLNVGGDFFTSAHNRAGSGGMGSNDAINRVLVGLRWDVAKNFQTTADWEGDYWHIQGPHNWAPLAPNASVNPTENWLRLGTGYNLTSNTVLKLMYEIGWFDGHGMLTEGNSGKTNVSNVVTAQAAVHF